MIDLHLVLPRRNTVACILPPVIAALLSCVFITVRPIADLSGSFAFLVSTLQFLYFYPAGTLSTLIESSGQFGTHLQSFDMSAHWNSVTRRHRSTLFPRRCNRSSIFGSDLILRNPL